MHVIILAAGRGTRMRPLSDAMPKPLLPVANRPIVTRVADAAVEAGADRLSIVVGYRHELIVDALGSSHRGCPIEYAIQERRDGTAAAVETAIDHVEGPFAVLNGDNVYDPASLEKLFAAAPAVGTTEVENPESYGVVSTNGDRVTGVVEKPVDPPSNLVTTGAYAFPAVASALLDVGPSERGERELTDVVRRLVDDWPVTTVPIDRWADVGHPWDLLAVTETLLGDVERRIDGTVHDDATVEGRVVVEAGAEIGPGVAIEGPVIVGQDAAVGPNAYLRPGTVLGTGASVGHSVEVKNSVLMADAAANHLAYVGDSVVGPDANLGAGTITANLRHDERPVLAGADAEPTGRRKFGAVIGPAAKTGIDTCLDPGAVVPADGRTRPGQTIARDAFELDPVEVAPPVETQTTPRVDR
ncbi:bifunctional sugar-1-phosphate nucleotidylyltransferase/acetyltransferase [Halococcoides cellulosivorans]|uniref:Bifunctional protein GlmU n=1 Tax=Halococcoides cellulosivorans TaxID=1679096 RepID=A0A2R4X3R4_9EURY|nr:bifunctional sugar-1-phosphate nucleotidylyltransferase/acetyltransferase [Halococcoides cellulosivorans]AWB28343.1 glucose-1-phosphate thymidylyltransferase [Halococcoides cellulosivorans]